MILLKLANLGNPCDRTIKLVDRKSATTSGESVNGKVVSKLSFGGNLEKPLLNGDFNIRNIRTKLKSMPVNITDGDIALRFNGNRSTLQGKIETVDSHLNLTGRQTGRILNIGRQN